MGHRPPCLSLILRARLRSPQRNRHDGGDFSPVMPGWQVPCCWRLALPRPLGPRRPWPVGGNGEGNAKGDQWDEWDEGDGWNAPPHAGEYWEVLGLGGRRGGGVWGVRPGFCRLKAELRTGAWYFGKVKTLYSPRSHEGHEAQSKAFIPFS